ncbi:hypothetical protein BDW71DRAFT_172251 [Aspergillus fruticulosus]
MATRRSHRKSRNGCDQCKKRRIKCDEGRPCVNCSRRGMACTFENRSSATPPNGQNDWGVLSDIGGRLLATYGDAPAPQSPSQDPFRVFNNRLSERAWFPQEWTAQDPELMHHYTLYTSKTFARRPQMQETWQTTIPEIAYSHEFLMHGLLGLSALHLAYLKPERYSHYLAGAGFHMSLGLRSYRRLILSPSSDNCHALFCFSSLVMVYIYASPTDSTEANTANGLASILELLALCRGTLVLLPYFDRIRQSPLKHLFLREFKADPRTELTHITARASHHFKDLPALLNNLHSLITTEIPTPAERTTFLHALDRLRATFTCLASTEKPLECGMLYMWPLSVEEQFFEFLRERHPVALVLLAFYCAQLHAFEDYWFVGKQGAVWLEHVEAALEPRFSDWLAWPRGVLASEGCW